MLLSLGVPGILLLGLLIAFGLDNTFWLVSISSFFFLLSLLAFRIFLKQNLPAKRTNAIAFFHPNANGGGGGERVLWCGIKGIQKAYPNAKVIVYCGDNLSGDQLKANASAKFGIKLDGDIEVVYLRDSNLLLPQQWPRFTLIGQAYGSVRLAYQALAKIRPQVYVDTSGWAFTYPLVRLAGVKVACYTHYPTISTDMLLRVARRKKMYNNEGLSSTRVGAVIKIVYYYVFACLYGIAGGCANIVMANSSWTQRHLKSLWWKLEEAKVVFPPCNTEILQKIPRLKKPESPYQLVSVAQFRPEKDHALQIESFALAQQELKRKGSGVGLQLAIAGGCRNPEDEARVQILRQKAKDLGVEKDVKFYVNAPYEEILFLLATSIAGLNTMIDEHFGISVVEYMAAGVIPLAHDSGGPKIDIIDDRTNGFLCGSKEQISESIQEVLAMEDKTWQSFVVSGKKKAQRFSEGKFEADFLSCLQNLLLLIE